MGLGPSKFGALEGAQANAARTALGNAIKTFLNTVNTSNKNVNAAKAYVAALKANNAHQELKDAANALLKAVATAKFHAEKVIIPNVVEAAKAGAQGEMPQAEAAKEVKNGTNQLIQLNRNLAALFTENMNNAARAATYLGQSRNLAKNLKNNYTRVLPGRLGGLKARAGIYNNPKYANKLWPAILKQKLINMPKETPRNEALQQLMALVNDKKRWKLVVNTGNLSSNRRNLLTLLQGGKVAAPSAPRIVAILANTTNAKLKNFTNLNKLKAYNAEIKAMPTPLTANVTAAQKRIANRIAELTAAPAAPGVNLPNKLNVNTTLAFATNKEKLALLTMNQLKFLSIRIDNTLANAYMSKPTPEQRSLLEAASRDVRKRHWEKMVNDSVQATRPEKLAKNTNLPYLYDTLRTVQALLTATAYKNNSKYKNIQPAINRILARIGELTPPKQKAMKRVNPYLGTTSNTNLNKYLSELATAGRTWEQNRNNIRKPARYFAPGSPYAKFFNRVKARANAQVTNANAKKKALREALNAATQSNVNALNTPAKVANLTNRINKAANAAGAPKNTGNVKNALNRLAKQAAAIKKARANNAARKIWAAAGSGGSATWNSTKPANLARLTALLGATNSSKLNLTGLTKKNIDDILKLTGANAVRFANNNGGGGKRNASHVRRFGSVLNYLESQGMFRSV